jgi:hypothetical protein
MFGAKVCILFAKLTQLYGGLGSFICKQVFNNQLFTKPLVFRAEVGSASTAKFCGFLPAVR